VGGPQGAVKDQGFPDLCFSDLPSAGPISERLAFDH
jgi:hypothetical protein